MTDGVSVLKDEENTPVSLSTGSLEDATLPLAIQVHSDGEAPAALPDLMFGKDLAERYDFPCVIGAGGMSVIYRATEMSTGKIVAIKMLNSRCLNETTVRRFQQEAKAITSLRHPNIISVKDLGVSETGHPYMVMDYVLGKNLSEVIKEKGSLSIEESLPRFLQVCDALQHAHSKGVLHRDIKPSNIMLSSQEGSFEDARIVDFGIAKLIDSEGKDLAATLTRTGELFGSPPYMSPEQWRGAAVDRRSDIYSMGCVMFETLTGKPPFRGDSVVETLMMHLNDTPPSLHEKCPDKQFSAPLESVIAKCLAKDPAERFQTMEELKFRLMQMGNADTVSRENLKNLRIPFKISRVGLVGILCLFLGIGISQCINQAGFIPQNSKESGDQAEGPPGIGFVTSSTQTLPNLSRYKRALVTDKFAMDFICDPRNRFESSIELAGAGPYLGDRGLEELRRLENLRKLELNGCLLTDRTMRQIGTLKFLEELHLQNTMITSAGVKELENLSSLQILDLRNNGINDECMPSISKFDKLTKLYLSNTRITDKAVSLLKNPQLRVLNLEHTQISDKSLETLGKRTKLIALDVADNALSDAGLSHLTNLTNMTELAIQRTNCTDNGLAFVEKMRELRKLQAGNRNITSAAVRHLQALPELVFLDLNDSSIDDKGLAEISKIQSIQSLSVNQTLITDAGLPELTKLPELAELNMSLTDVSSEGIRVLGKSKKLKVLDVFLCPKVTGSGNQLRDILPHTELVHTVY